MRRDRVSNAVIRRLPRYYRYVDDLHNNGEVRISSSALGKSMGLTASQIRQDLSCFGEFGQQGYGYDVEKLRSALINILGMNNAYKAILVGAGNLGRALIQNFNFCHAGLQLVAAFDVSPDLVGGMVCGVPIYHVDDLEKEIWRIGPAVGVLTTPQSIASEIANRMVAAGIVGLWNFTNVELKLEEPEKAIMEDVHFADSLLALSYMLSARSIQEEKENED